MPKKNNKKATKKNEVVNKDNGKEKADTKAIEVDESQEIDIEESRVDDKAAENPEVCEDISNVEHNTELNNETGIAKEKAIPAVAVSESKESVEDSQELQQASLPTTDSIPPKTKKRLTLLERLALAAKGKKQRSSTPTPTSSAGGTPPVNAPEEPMNININEGSDPLADNNVSLKVKENVHNTGLENNLESHDNYSEEIARLTAEIRNLRANNSELSDENKRLNAQSSKPGSIKEISNLKEQLSSKDETIEQLMKEGQALSVKELKLNESIKKLKASNNDLEQSLNDYSKKNEQILLQLNEQEDFLKKHKFKSINQLIDNYNDISNKLAQSNDNLEKEKQLDWEGKYKEQQRLYEAESTEKKQAIKQLNEIKIQFDMSKKQNSLELESKNTTINDLKRNINSIRDENSKEIYRLENKIESLRVENERSVGGFSDKKDYNDGGEKDQTEASSSKHIDYEEFVKLSNNHHNLQQQYLSSQENWKMIESNLLNKVDSLTSSVDALKKSKTKSTNELQKVQNSLQKKIEEYDQLNEKFEELTNEKEELLFQNQVKDTDYQELQEKFDKFQQIYNTDRQNLNSKIKKLTESLEKSKNNSNTNLGPFDQTSPSKQNINGLNLNLEPPKFTKHLSSTSINEASYNNSGWPDIKFGESSTTPAISREYSSVFMSHSHNNSLASLMDNADMGTELGNDNYSFNSKYASHIGNGSISGVIPTSGNNNIQLINKMSSNIRRLEIELSTMKDENTQLSLEKEQAQQEILKQFKLVEEVNSLKEQITALQTEIDEKSKQEETMLELIGEKSEQVEELRADVQDLKDLCKSQVQQMIEIQESK